MDAARLFGSALLEPRGNGFEVRIALGDYRYPPGYMLGLAGIGRYFLRLAAPEKTPLPLTCPAKRRRREGGWCAREARTFQ
jgi:hypothetical protein